MIRSPRKGPHIDWGALSPLAAIDRTERMWSLIVGLPPAVRACGSAASRAHDRRAQAPTLGMTIWQWPERI